MIPPLVSAMIARARRRSLLLILLLVVFLAGVGVGLKILAIQTVMESALNGLIALALAVRAVKL